MVKMTAVKKGEKKTMVGSRTFGALDERRAVVLWWVFSPAVNQRLGIVTIRVSSRQKSQKCLKNESCGDGVFFWGDGPGEPLWFGSLRR